MGTAEIKSEQIFKVNKFIFFIYESFYSSYNSCTIVTFMNGKFWIIEGWNFRFLNKILKRGN